MLIADVINFANGYSKYTNITADIMDNSNDAICFRQMGDNIVLSRYIGGGMIGTFGFAILCKTDEKERKKAINQLNYYKELFDMNTSVILTDNLRLINSEKVSDIELVERSDNKQTTYGITIKLIFEED